MYKVHRRTTYSLEYGCSLGIPCNIKHKMFLKRLDYYQCKITFHGNETKFRYSSIQRIPLLTYRNASYQNFFQLSTFNKPQTTSLVELSSIAI